MTFWILIHKSSNFLQLIIFFEDLFNRTLNFALWNSILEWVILSLIVLHLCLIVFNVFRTVPWTELLKYRLWVFNDFVNYWGFFLWWLPQITTITFRCIIIYCISNWGFAHYRVFIIWVSVTSDNFVIEEETSLLHLVAFCWI